MFLLPAPDVALDFVQRCQVEILCGATDDYLSLIQSVWRCLAEFPREGSDPERTTAVAAVARIAFGVLSWKWRARKWETRRRRYANAALMFARMHYRSSALSQADAAAHIGLSIGCLSRALTAETNWDRGSAFRRHLNDIRLFAAIVQMQERSPALLKAIATDVGYVHTAALDRQFQDRFALSPRVFLTLLRMALLKRPNQADIA